MSSTIQVDTIKDIGGNTIISSDGSGTFTSSLPTPTTGIAASAITTGTMATARLGSGTASSSTFLRGDQTYAAVGGAWNLLLTSNASGTSSVTFNSTYITSTYEVYKIVINGLTSSSDGDSIRISAATDNSTFTHQGYAGLSAFATTTGSAFTTFTGQPNAAGAIAIGYYISDFAASKGFNTDIIIYNANGNTETMLDINTVQRSSQNKFVNEKGVLRFNQGSLNAFKFDCNAGNMTGKFSLYGLVQ